MADLRRILSNDIRNSYAPMNKDEELACVINAKAGDKVAQNKLVNSQLKTIVSFARSYSNNTNIIEELISEGSIGLIHAINIYDINKANDIRFGCYAMWWIREHISNYVCDNNLIRLPRNHTKGKKENAIHSVSIHAPICDDDGNSTNFESMIKDDNCISASVLAEYKNVMDKLSQSLTPREMDMIEARVVDEMSYENMGTIFSINTREGVRQNFNKALAKAQSICHA